MKVPVFSKHTSCLANKHLEREPPNSSRFRPPVVAVEDVPKTSRLTPSAAASSLSSAVAAAAASSLSSAVAAAEEAAAEAAMRMRSPRLSGPAGTTADSPCLSGPAATTADTADTAKAAAGLSALGNAAAQAGQPGKQRPLQNLAVGAVPAVLVAAPWKPAGLETAQLGCWPAKVLLADGCPAKNLLLGHVLLAPARALPDQI